MSAVLLQCWVVHEEMDSSGRQQVESGAAGGYKDDSFHDDDRCGCEGRGGVGGGGPCGWRAGGL